VADILLGDCDVLGGFGEGDVFGGVDAEGTGDVGRLELY